MIAQREYTRRGINMRNEMKMEFDAVSNNEGFARVAVAAFIAPLNPTLEEVSDIKTAVSEAVTNSIIHGYENIYGYGRHGAEKPEGMVKGNAFLSYGKRSAVHNSGGPGKRDGECGAGYGAFIHFQAGAGTIGYGLCLHGGLHGRSGGGKRTGDGNHSKDAEKAGDRLLD